MGGPGARRGEHRRNPPVIKLPQNGSDRVEGLDGLRLHQLRLLIAAAYQLYLDKRREYIHGEPATRDTSGVKTYATSDYAVAAYLRQHRVLFLGVADNDDPTAGPWQNALFVFADDGTGQIERLKRELMNSELVQYDSFQRFFKKLARERREDNR